MNRQELIDNLTNDILAYVMQGQFPEDFVAEELKPEGLDERFDEYEKLLDLHFVLQPDVVTFVKNLPNQLRSIKTETRNVSRTYQGTVQGRINWSSTIKKRATDSPGNHALFVCDRRNEDYNIDENIVLKKLLAVIYETLDNCQELIEQEYDWVTERWRENEDLIDQLRTIVERNIHVTRIDEPEEYEPTERMMISAETSRETIYQDAAELLRQRDEIFHGDEDQIRELLDSTAITPDDENTLLELYVLFRFIATIEQMRDEQFQVKTIESGSQAIAEIEGEPTISIYHDESASEQDLSFHPAVLEKDEDEELSRAEKVQKETKSVLRSYFSDREFAEYTGRPDVIVIEIASEDDRQFIITEVKNSRNMDTIRTGVKETLEYLVNLKQHEEFVYPDFSDSIQSTHFGSGWNGVLVTQDHDRETAPIEDHEHIKILQASEVEDNLEQIVTQAIGGAD